MSVLDPVTLAVIDSGLRQVCNEMDLAFVRSAFSPVISEALDRSDGIYAADDGALIAQGELGLPIFVGTMQDSTAAVIARAGEIRDGDIYVVNDPYLGGTHLMDVRFVMPYFHGGATIRLAGQHRALARHRRHGAGWILGERHRGRAGRPAPAACQAGQSRQDG